MSFAFFEKPSSKHRKGETMNYYPKPEPRFKCAMCKRTLLGQPALKNGTGIYCDECKAIIHARSAEKHRVRRAAQNEQCPWCGKPITPTRPAGRSHVNCYIHLTCERHRDWLLKCIRHSDYVAKYVARTEAKEAPRRKERQCQTNVSVQTTTKANTPSDENTRLTKVEHMLNKLMKALTEV